jgi:hypothetical protein
MHIHTFLSFISMRLNISLTEVAVGGLAFPSASGRRRFIVQDWSYCCKLQSCCGGGEAGSNIGEEGKGSGSDEEINQSNEVQL